MYLQLEMGRCQKCVYREVVNANRIDSGTLHFSTPQPNTEVSS